jgi:hypothetical protein
MVASPLRHSSQGGFGKEYEGQDFEVEENTAYERQRDERKKCLTEELKLLFQKSGVTLDDAMRADFLGESTKEAKVGVRQGRARTERRKNLKPSSSRVVEAMRRRSSRNICKGKKSAPRGLDNGNPNEPKINFRTYPGWSLFLYCNVAGFRSI